MHGMRERAYYSGSVHDTLLHSDDISGDVF
jgi:hypothetical protein